MKPTKPTIQEPDDTTSKALDVMTIICLLMASLGFWILMATAGKSPSLWVLIPGWYFLLAGGATLVVIHYGRFIKGDLHSKLDDALR